MLKVVILAAALAALTSCGPAEPPSLEWTIAVAVAQIARTPGYVSYETVETEMQLQEAGLRTDYSDKRDHYTPKDGLGWGYQGYSALRYDPVRPDARIEHVV